MIILFMFLGITLATTASSVHAGQKITDSNIAARYSFTDQKVEGKTTTFRRSDGSSLTIEDQSRRIKLCGALVWMLEPAVFSANRFLIGSADAALSLDPVLLPQKRKPSGPKWIITIDPGHGGSDTGAISQRLVLEKKITLDIAKRVRRHLKDCDAIVKLTREKDRDIGLRARTEAALNWKSDIFVSIHLNSAQNPSASGIETYILTPSGYSSTASSAPNTTASAGNKFDSQNMALAYMIHIGLINSSGAQDRGIRRARFEVLKTAPCPAVLVECAFLSNPEEENKIISSKYRNALAKGIADGIRNYIAR